ncbi:MAG: ThiF family adenylyltransferase [Bacilli bacterium]|nr:ThiF family adenylyltransferase [Bacilli bacterium]
MNDSRTIKLIGEENNKMLKSKNILLVGLGGVGGSTFEMLIRSGINNITIIDFDKFEESNLNRQILSDSSNISLYKVDVAKKRASLINKECNVLAYNSKIDEEFIKNINTNYDYIIDAIDDIKAKVLLVKFATSNNIKIISSCGTGNRLNPEKLYITNIWKTSNDPLARKLRYLLRKEKISYKLPVVSSKELPLIKTNNFVGSMAMVPNSAGIMLASYVINDILRGSDNNV